MNTPSKGYPYESLRLACGCYEVVTGKGMGTVHWCDLHPADEGAPPYVLYAARQAISEHGIVTVAHGGGVKRLEDVT